MINNPWFQLCASVIAMIMIANLQYAWTLFVTPLQEGTGWELSDIQWAFTLFILFQTWVQPAQGWLIDRMGPHLFISAAGVLCGIGWGGLGMVTSLPQLYALYVLAGVGAALVYGGSMGSALKWFKQRRGLASGILAAGFGGGTALFMPFIAYIIEAYGYQTAFLWTGVFQGVIILIVAQFLRHPPKEAQPAKAAASTAGASMSTKIGDHQFTTGEMLRAPQFYVLYVMFVMIATGGLLVTANARPMAESWGVSLGMLTVALSLNPLANGASRIFWGWASDKMGRELAMGIAFSLQAIFLVTVIAFGQASEILFTITLILVFFTWGEVFSLFPSITGDYFGTRHSTSNYGLMYSAKGVAAIIGGGLAAMLYEQFGSWSAGMYGSAVLAAIAAIMAFGLRATMAQRRANVGAPA